MSEPSIHQGTCSYCGDAPINHTFSYFESLIAFPFDKYTAGTTKYAPAFLKRFANWIPIGLFNTLSYLGLAHFSSDINKACSFRSRLIWEEARRRGIDMQQVIFGKKPLEWYKAVIGDRTIYFESIPIQPEFLDLKKDWDNKIILKKELLKHDIPVPRYVGLPFWKTRNLKGIYSSLTPPVIIKPQLGSRSRHTITNINTLAQFKEAVAITGQISSHIVIEEHLHGHVCRATVVGGVIAGFYKGTAPSVVGDGKKTIRQLIEEKDEHRPDRVERMRLGDELYAHIARAGFHIDDVLPEGIPLILSHRPGRLFGGTTKEMLDELHPSFIPILQKAAKVTGLSVVGFDCIIPDPTEDASSQRWGIIECNTLPFIDLHYYALEGKPRNIAGMIWDLWGTGN